MLHHFKDEFSTRVSIWLEVDDRCLSVSQVGEDRLILRDEHNVSPDQSAQIRLTIDGEERLFPVVLQGQSGRLVHFAHCDRAYSQNAEQYVPF